MTDPRQATIDAAEALNWTESPQRTQWGGGMMEALLPLGKDHTLRLYAEREALHLVPPALRASLAETPARWKRVPVEPTNAMKEAALIERANDRPTGNIWRAMLAAAPSLPASGAEPVAPVLVRDVAEVLGVDVPTVCAALMACGRSRRSTNMEVSGEELLAVWKHLRATPASAPPAAEPPCGQINSGVPCDMPRAGDDRVCPDCNPRPSASAPAASVVEVLDRCIAGIEHLAEIARQWEPDHSSGADRRGWVLAKDAADDARELRAALSTPHADRGMVPLTEENTDGRV